MIYLYDRKDLKRRIMMKAVVDRDACIGCGLCASDCPGVFQLDDDTISTVIVDEIPADLEDCAQAAVENCPESAITVE
jgi:ferredoxin